MEPRTYDEMLREVVRRRPDRPAYRVRRHERWVPVTWADHGRAVRRVSKALIALGLGKGDTVCILSRTRLEWVQADMGIVGCGGATVGIYQSLLAPDCRHIIDHSDAVAIFVEDDEQLGKVLASRGELERLSHIVRFDGPSDPSRGVLSWDDFLARADEVTDERLERRAAEITSDDLAAIVYTSGTTGVPKGAMITHHNVVFSTWSACQSLSLEPGYETLLFLPLAHVFARLIIFVCMSDDVVVSFAEDLERVPANLRETRPHFIAAVPRFYEKVREGARARAGNGAKGRLFDWAVGVGERVRRLEREGRAVPLGLRLGMAVADRLVLRKIRDGLGGRLDYCVSGAAPLPVHVAEFFHACGIVVLEGIGMTENMSFSNVNPRDAFRFGTVGPTGPGIEVRIAEDGEILFRGGNVMKGYYKDARATAEAIDADGWLHTGDVGRLDDDGYLRVTDRKKELIKTSGGKFVAPQRVEDALRASRYIAQAVAYGDQRKYITALVTLDEAAVRAWARGRGLDEGGIEALARRPEVRELIEAEIDTANEGLSSFERVKRFRILPRDLTIESGELTPTLKVKRKVVVERNRTLLEEMYAA